MNWYYTREAGDEGQVLTDEGTPPGSPITVVLRRGPIPMAVCLEVIAFLADILTIAEEDKALHGDINPGDVYVDANASVSLAGYGPVRRSGRAPDSPPQLPSSDVYGLGIVLHALLSSEPMGAIPRERDAHDDAIVDRLLAIDWSEMEGLPGRDPVIHFLCSMLAHSPAERPAPLDVANIVSEVALKMGGQSLTEWARSLTPQSAHVTDVPDIEEALAAPQEMGKVFNKTGQYSRRKTASAKGECTAFWSRDKISAMLDDGEDQMSGSAMFDRRNLAEMLEKQEDPPAPSPMPRHREYPEERPWSPDATLTGNNAPDDLKEAISELKKSASRERVSLPPSPPPVRPNQPAPAPVAVAVEVPPAEPPPQVAVSPKTSRVSAPPNREPVKKPFPWVPVMIGVVGMGIVLGLFAVAGVAYMYLDRQPEVAAPDPEPVEEAVEPEAKPEVEASKKSRPSSKRSARSTRSSRPKKNTKSSSQNRAAPAPASGDFEITFRAMCEKAKLQCGDGQSGSFVGMTRRKFSGFTTCRIDIGDAKGAVQVNKSGTVNCSAAGTMVRCTGP